MQRRPPRGSDDLGRRVDEERDEHGQRDRRDHRVVGDDLVVEDELAALLPVDRPGRAAELDPSRFARESGGQLADAAARVEKLHVVAELAIVEPDGAGNDVLELGIGTKRAHQSAVISVGATPQSAWL